MRRIYHYMMWLLYLMFHSYLLLFQKHVYVATFWSLTKPILGPVTMHICEPDNKQSQAINRSMNSEMPKPVAFLIHRCLLPEKENGGMQ
jgi:hypothetical protein